jgi:hypothetical protein
VAAADCGATADDARGPTAATPNRGGVSACRP